jgi:hypothetical protein
MYETRLKTNVRNEVENQCTKRGWKPVYETRLKTNVRNEVENQCTKRGWKPMYETTLKTNVRNEVESLCVINPLTPNGPYSGRTAPLTSKPCVLYIYSTNIGFEYFKHGIYSPFFSLQNAVCFIILTYLVPVLFTFCIQGVLKLKKKNSGPKRLTSYWVLFCYSLQNCSLYKVQPRCFISTCLVSRTERWDCV